MAHDRPYVKGTTVASENSGRFGLDRPLTNSESIGIGFKPHESTHKWLSQRRIMTESEEIENRVFMISLMLPWQSGSSLD